jgi:CRP-like cAMP-binding protein
MSALQHAVARPRRARPRGFVDECGELAVELRRLCAAVVLPAGAFRRCDDLPPARAFVVEDGVVLVRSLGGEGVRRMVVASCVAGDVLTPPLSGETFHALTDAWLTAVSPVAWRRLLQSPKDADRLVTGLESTARRQREAVRALAGVRHVDRVRAQLLELAREHGRVGRESVRLDLPITHELIADMVGCARETVTRAFEELQRSGFVRRRGRFYELLVQPELLASS